MELVLASNNPGKAKALYVCLGITVAELDNHEKDRISHRGKALRQLLKFLE